LVISLRSRLGRRRVAESQARGILARVGVFSYDGDRSLRLDRLGCYDRYQKADRVTPLGRTREGKFAMISERE
jgi:hypothetical protein